MEKNTKIRTMADLSKALGMSRATVSKYFQDPNSVRHSTKKRIEDALEAVDYVPNFFARNLNRQRTKLIGVIIPHFSDVYYMSLVEVIENAARQQDYKVIVQISNSSRRDETKSLETLKSMNAAGVIIAPIGSNSDVEMINRINQELPLVFVDSDLTGKSSDIPFVGTDNFQSIGLLVDYLCRTGTPPVFLDMPVTNQNASQRARVYAQRMTELGHRPQIISKPDDISRWDFEAYAYARMKIEFAESRYRDASILCANDRLAMGGMRAANEAGLFTAEHGEMPTFRIAGHDDHPLSQYLWPALTTVAQDAELMGKTAFELVMKRALMPDRGAEDGGSTLLKALLVLRDSA